VNREDIDGKLLLDLQRQESVQDEGEHLIRILDVDDCREIGRFWVVDPGPQRKRCRGIACQNRVLKLGNDLLSAGIKRPGGGCLGSYDRSPPVWIAATKVWVRRTARRAWTSVTQCRS